MRAAETQQAQDPAANFLRLGRVPNRYRNGLDRVEEVAGIVVGCPAGIPLQGRE